MVLPSFEKEGVPSSNSVFTSSSSSTGASQLPCSSCLIRKKSLFRWPVMALIVVLVGTFRCTGRGEVELVVFLTVKHRAEFAAARVEFLHPLDDITVRVLFPLRGQFASFDTVEGQLAFRV